MKDIKYWIDKLGLQVKWCSIFGVSWYDWEVKTIRMNFLEGSFLMYLIKKWLKRPTHQSYTLVHEVGHAFLDAYGNNVEGRALFGDFDLPYPDDGFAIRDKLSEKEGFITTYAQVHPEEDFAETFAFVFLGLEIKDSCQEKANFIRALLNKHV